MRSIGFSGEDELAEALAKRCVHHLNPDLHFESMRPRQGGKSGVERKFGSYIKTAEHYPILVMIDLDDGECPPSVYNGFLRSNGLTQLPRMLVLSIIQKETEAWLLGDYEGLCKFLGLNAVDLRGCPEEIVDPKKFIVDLARDSRRYADEICPTVGAKVGPGYNYWLSQFVEQQWNVERATERCPSLHRTLERLRNLWE